MRPRQQHTMQALAHIDKADRPRTRSVPLGIVQQPVPIAADRSDIFPLDRLRALGAVAPATRARMDQLVELAKNGLPRMYRKGSFAHTVRGVKTAKGKAVRAEGDSLRYAIDVALGLSFTSIEEQRRILKGVTAADLISTTATRAEFSSDPGAVALAAWTSAEAAGKYAAPLFNRLTAWLESGEPVNTVDCAWALLAAVAARHLGDTARLTTMARNRLIEAQGPFGLFPHGLPASSNGRWRAHVGCFADQVYTIQALARLHVASPDEEALSAAEACAARICALQGPAGQWWWHYDVRDGSVVEGYPVYSVHQHAMAPMALLDLREAGGTDHLAAVVKGVQWLDTHPEIDTPLVSEEHGVIWRKVARREPKKAARAIAAVTTAIRPGLHLPGLNLVFPTTYVDYECRPYEFGWLLYAWLCGGTVAGLSGRDPKPAVSRTWGA